MRPKLDKENHSTHSYMFHKLQLSAKLIKLKDETFVYFVEKNEIEILFAKMKSNNCFSKEKLHEIKYDKIL